MSSGPRATVVPQLTAQTERTARIRLEQGGLGVVSVSEFRSPVFPADTVIAQDPPAATLAPGVSLLINRGEEGAAYVMPDVIGIDGTRAADTLRRQGLRVTVVGSQPYPGVPPGTTGSCSVATAVARQATGAKAPRSPGTPLSRTFPS